MPQPGRTRLDDALGYEASVRVTRTWAGTDGRLDGARVITVDAQLIVTGPGLQVDAPGAWGGRLSGVAGWSAGGIGSEADLELPDGRLARVQLVRVEPRAVEAEANPVPEVVWVVGVGAAPFAAPVGRPALTDPAGPTVAASRPGASSPVRPAAAVSDAASPVVRGTPGRERAWLRPVLVTGAVVVVAAIVVGLAGLGLSALGSIDVGTLAEAHDPDLPTTVPPTTAPAEVHNVVPVNLRRGPSGFTGVMSRIPKGGRIDIICIARGEAIADRGRRDDRWAKIRWADMTGYISIVYLDTDLDPPSAGGAPATRNC